MVDDLGEFSVCGATSIVARLLPNNKVLSSKCNNVSLHTFEPLDLSNFDMDGGAVTSNGW